jgi:3-methyladenine DNA glycosylase AlkD
MATSRHPTMADQTTRKRIPTLAALKRELSRASDRERMRTLTWYKAGKGEYAEHDKFIGVSWPKLRGIAANYHHLKLAEIDTLLNSPIHEYRFTALLILVARYQDGDGRMRGKIFDFYLNHTHRINNWDLVDISASFIVGEHLVRKSRRILYCLAQSSELWERRIAMVATSAFIQRGDLKDTFALAKHLLGDSHDLIQKAIGWMLREAGKHSRARMIDFLKRNYSQMPRTTLRYAIEHLPQVQRKRALQGLFS